MSHAGIRSRNHPQQVAARRPGSIDIFPEGDDAVDPTDAVDDRATPREVFGPLHERFGFTIDVAASAANAKLPRFYTRETDGLSQSWAGERVWCNPPFSEIRPWVAKAWAEAAPLCVMLLPANRTEQAWWQFHVEPFRDRGGLLRTEFLPGRPRFIRPGATSTTGDRPVFGCVLLIWEVA